MDLFELIQNLTTDTTDRSVPVFLPELILCGTILALLLVRLFRSTAGINPGWISFAGASAALCALAHPMAAAEVTGRCEIFRGMLVHDQFGVFVRILLVLFLVLFTLLVLLTKNPGKRGGTDFFVLVFGATVGMCVMATSNHLLAVFLGVEMAGVPCYVLAGFRRHERLGSEASLKYAVYGAASAGVMLFGISLLSGILGSFSLSELGWNLAHLQPHMDQGTKIALVLGAIMLAVGLMFKLSAVPLHFWLPDVFEGATAEVNAFLSVASKTAALALLVRVVFGFGGVPLPTHLAGANTDAPVVTIEFINSEDAARELPDSKPESDPASAQILKEVIRTGKQRNDAIANLAPARQFMALLLAVVAAVTCTFGNLAAYAQKNIKRMLAYSTIAHAGYMIAAVPAALMLYGITDNNGSQIAVAGLLIYMTAYLFMNFGAFAVVALLRDKLGSEEIADYAGLVKSRPGVVICFSLMLFSLVGLPPLAGFIGKLVVFASLAQGWQDAGANWLLVLLCITAINTAISLFYYLRVVKVMTIDAPSEKVLDRPASLPTMGSLAGVFIIVITIPTALLIFAWGPLQSWVMYAAAVFG